MIVLAILVAPLLLLSLHDLVRRPTLRRLAFRNATRRRGEAALVVAGSLLAGAIITASFIVGDTLGASIRDFARTQLGPVDEVVRASKLEDLPALDRALAAPIPGSDGTLSLVRVNATAATFGTNRKAEPKATLLETDFARARRFGGDAKATGFASAGRTPGPGEAAVTKDLAHKLGVRAGSSIAVYAYGQELRFRVTEVLPQLGVAGLGGRFDVPSNVFVEPGTIARAAAAATGPAAAASPPDPLVFVSNDGGVFDGDVHTAAVDAAIRQRLQGSVGYEVQDRKHDVLQNADAAAKSFTQLFGGIGAFSVIAGVLLLVNIFVMLADERKSELGMLRAVGMRRNQLVRGFGIEGGLYAVVASVVGAFGGIALGRLIVIAAQGVFNQDRDARLSLRFAVHADSLAKGLLIGLFIGMVTVWATSVRIGRLNVIRAIRDIPEPRLTRQRLRTLVLASLGVLLGGVLFATGVSAENAFPVLAGVPIAAFCAIPLLSRALPRRIAVSGCAAVALVWAVICFGLFPKVFANVDIPLFVVQGVILVAGAVVLLTTNADITGHAMQRLTARSSRTLGARLGLAYPLARKFRTAMLLGMYALVIFTMTFLSVFSNLFAKQAPQFTTETRAGYDILVDSSGGNPVTADALARQPGVDAVAAFTRSNPKFTTAYHPEQANWPMTGFDESYLRFGQVKLNKRLARFPSDRAALQAVMTDPSLGIFSDFFLQNGGGPPKGGLHLGDAVTVFSRTGEPHTITVAALLPSDWTFNGVLVGSDFMRSFLGGEAVASRHYVRVKTGADPAAVSTRLEGNLLTNGVDAEAISSLVRRQLRQQEGFFTLMQGYLALGLVVGIVGLGVVMVRAVRERRRQIGMLRAMGFPSRVVRTAFLFEAVFIALQGIVVGTVLALIVSWSLLSNSNAFGENRLHFAVPWLSLTIVLAATLAASLLAILLPATQAARIRPAVALRIAD